MIKSVYIAKNATVVGDVELGENVNIWYGAVLRGDCGKITIGEGSNVQDNSVLHEKVTMGKGCTVGHAAILHGCTIGDNCLIGMGAIVLDGAKLGNDCLVAAGSVVTGKVDAPDGSLILGNPATVVKPLRPEQIEATRQNGLHYIQLAKQQLK